MVLTLTVTACTNAVVEPSPTLPPVTVTQPPPATTTITSPVEAAVDRFRDCLVDRGVEIEEIPLDAYGRPRFDLVLGEIDFSDPANVSALAECRDPLAGGALDLSLTPGLRNEVMERLEAFASCVRARGVEGFPDPISNYDGTGSPFSVDLIPYGDPELSVAVEVCRTRLVRPFS